MRVLGLIALLVYTFGVFTYGAMLALWVREFGRVRWAAQRDGDPHGESGADPISGALFVVGLLWFVVNLLIQIAEFGPGLNVWPVYAVSLWLAFSFPPLIMHITWSEVRRTHPGAIAWKAAIWPMYVLTLGFALLSTLGFARIGPVPVETVGVASTAALVGSFVAAAAYCIALMRRYSSAPSAREQQSNRWTIALFVAMAGLFPLILILDSATTPRALAASFVQLATKSLPLTFVFVGAYFESRYEFFDLLVKRGLALAATILVLTGSFTLAMPLLRWFDGSWAAPWIYAVLLLPPVMAMPWLYTRIGLVLDRRWLGRRFTTIEAVTHFLAALRSATTEAQLVERAQAGLSEIFGAPVLVRTSSSRAGGSPDFDIIQETPVRSGSRHAGWFLMGRRESEAPYFSEDVVLLASLADVFASMLDNIRLQNRQQEQDRRSHELTLHASRSELKALRAQINPHFLFNALNAIAGLIPRDPAVADQTIEKLADVFRYALRGAESEWAVLEDELEFVRAYLDVERARFGARLRTEVRLAGDARGARVPTMVVQTLVENAVKHGASAVRGQATVSVEARCHNGALTVTVADNGPGFEPGTKGPSSGRGGIGLANIRQRLAGYFQDRASLTVERDAARGLTIATLTLPLVTEEPRLVAESALVEDPP